MATETAGDQNDTGSQVENDTAPTTSDTTKNNERLCAAVHYTVGKICDEQSARDADKRTFSKEFIVQLSKLLFDTVSIDWALDLQAFARHAKRSSINVDDVKLLVRRNPALLRKMTEEADKLMAVTLVQREQSKQKRQKKKEMGRDVLMDIDGDDNSNQSAPTTAPVSSTLNDSFGLDVDDIDLDALDNLGSAGPSSTSTPRSSTYNRRSNSRQTTGRKLCKSPSLARSTASAHDDVVDLTHLDSDMVFDEETEKTATSMRVTSRDDTMTPRKMGQNAIRASTSSAKASTSARASTSSIKGKASTSSTKGKASTSSIKGKASTSSAKASTSSAKASTSSAKASTSSTSSTKASTSSAKASTSSAKASTKASTSSTMPSTSAATGAQSPGTGLLRYFSPEKHDGTTKTEEHKTNEECRKRRKTSDSGETKTAKKRISSTVAIKPPTVSFTERDSDQDLALFD